MLFSFQLEKDATLSPYVSLMLISSTETVDLHEALMTTVKFSLTVGMFTRLVKHLLNVDDCFPELALTRSVPRGAYTTHAAA